ncbi:glycosyltransferase [Bacillus sp. ISL-35]|uniref:glycosyltransferase family 2 protein n=1 Tax=Bacillus sp. ISL-35 TaxID=2819122 RepID=UPI001BE57DEC|nr:glycosyltransferase [Bacillus sp. ISL-35]MBT2704852.1 glycosyltransferase [Chryseobacterium sp. ISL-80]
MNPKISIIVPVYKVEKYLHKCINSILAQTFTDFELILIDDGSPDNCGRICDKYARKDSRVSVIHKENGGLASARNAGLDIAKGEYIGFVDSDDWIESDMYELLYDLCTENDCDISNISSIIYFKDRIQKNGTHPLIVHQKSEAMKAMLVGDLYDEVVWTKLIKRTLLEDIRFSEGMVYEDTAFTYKVIHKSKKVCSIGAPKYHYIKREESIMDNAKKSIRIDAVLIYDEMFKFMEKYYPDLTSLVSLKLANSALVIMNAISGHDEFNKYKNHFKTVTNILNSYYSTLMRLKEYPRNVKILLTAAKCHPIFYKLLVNQLPRRMQA